MAANSWQCVSLLNENGFVQSALMPVLGISVASDAIKSPYGHDSNVYDERKRDERDERDREKREI